MVCNKKKENWFLLNGNGIMSSFLGRQFYRSTLELVILFLAFILYFYIAFSINHYDDFFCEL